VVTEEQTLALEQRLLLQQVLHLELLVQAAQQELLLLLEIQAVAVAVEAVQVKLLVL
jgi:hypothetical protein